MVAALFWESAVARGEGPSMARLALGLVDAGVDHRWGCGPLTGWGHGLSSVGGAPEEVLRSQGSTSTAGIPSQVNGVGAAASRGDVVPSTGASGGGLGEARLLMGAHGARAVGRLQRSSLRVGEGLSSLGFLVPGEQGELGGVLLCGADQMDRTEIGSEIGRKMGLVGAPCDIAVALGPGTSGAGADHDKVRVVLGG
jgi:hypothetical protein